MICGKSLASALCVLTAVWLSSMNVRAETEVPIINHSFENGGAQTGVPNGWTLTGGSATGLGIVPGGSDGSQKLWVGPDVSIRQDLSHTLQEGEELTLRYQSSRGTNYARKVQLYAKSGTTYALMA